MSERKDEKIQDIDIKDLENLLKEGNKEKISEFLEEKYSKKLDIYKDYKREVATLIPIRGMVVFPGNTVHFDVGREKSLAALESAMKNDKLIFLVSQFNPAIEEPTKDDLELSGTVSRVKQVLKLQNGVVRVLVEGIYKGELDQFLRIEPYYEALIAIPEEKYDDLDEVKAIARVLRKLFVRYVKDVKVPVDDVSSIRLISFEDIQKYTYLVASKLITLPHMQSSILNKKSLKERIELLIELLEDELKIIKLEKSIAKKTNEKMEKHQKEYYLKQQIRVIQEELGDKEDIITEIEKYRDKIKELKLPNHVADKLNSEIKKLEKVDSLSGEGANIRTYIDTVFKVPWKKSSKDNYNLEKVKDILEKSHYGLEDVKERILEYVAVRKLNNGLKGPIICLVGPPGVGKTSIASSIAASMNRKFVRMSLGGVKDEAEIRGHRRTYVGAIPGRVISSMLDVGVVNPVFLLDEIDKMGSDYKGDPASAMLEVLDPEQNKTFKDHYLELEYDLSKVFFITTANTLDTIPRPLRDRMEIIEVSGYTDIEKKAIAREYLVSKQAQEHGIKKDALKITDDALKLIVSDYTRESGVRNLQRQIAKVCRKTAVKFAEDENLKIIIEGKDVVDYLGPSIFKYKEGGLKDKVGVVMGLAWTQYGGDTLPVEVAIMKGTGKLELTGKLGDVMKESAKIAYSYVRANSDKYGIDEEFYKKYDIHIHAPEGAVPKDGPSAGVTMVTAIVSALSKNPVRGDIAMTGEVTLTGNVLAIGGVKEKSLSAYRAGIKTIILPEENRKDIDKVPEYIRQDINFVFAEKVDVVLNTALRGELNDN
ncbi:endopeptidase La [Clostridium cylindrosporum]|uniref:Lon protease n=1 Tax=Clostridium cylindrosporum DSM 605 TaxID=1121307 RepID=A0A0J8G509_CLOCY|nr:endopeptidase La [Clostridium cylindrosporum]KMT22756.1 Lon protease Lon [Clostridium cylindrosporum DSM 605]